MTIKTELEWHSIKENPEFDRRFLAYSVHKSILFWWARGIKHKDWNITCKCYGIIAWAYAPELNVEDFEEG